MGGETSVLREIEESLPANMEILTTRFMMLEERFRGEYGKQLEIGFTTYGGSTIHQTILKNTPDRIWSVQPQQALPGYDIRVAKVETVTTTMQPEAIRAVEYIQQAREAGERLSRLTVTDLENLAQIPGILADMLDTLNDARTFFHTGEEQIETRMQVHSDGWSGDGAQKYYNAMDLQKGAFHATQNDISLTHTLTLELKNQTIDLLLALVELYKANIDRWVDLSDQVLGFNYSVEGLANAAKSVLAWQTIAKLIRDEMVQKVQEQANEFAGLLALIRQSSATEELLRLCATIPRDSWPTPGNLNGEWNQTGP